MISDLRFALRQIARSPGFTAVAVLTLALGVGLNTSMFSIMNVLLLRPLPYPDGGRLVRVFATTPQADSWALTAPVCRELKDAGAGFERVAVFGWWGANLTEPGRPAELLVSLRTSAEFLPALGVQPALGRWFTEADDHPGNGVVLISHDLWRRVYQGDPAVVGRTILVDREPVTVIGVMPASIAAPMVFGVVDVWRPLALTETQQANASDRWLHIVARLAAGQTLESAGSVLDTVAARVARDHPRENEGVGLRAVPLHASATDRAGRTITWLTLALSSFVLLIACANLASLQLARAAARGREIALRAALGASRLHLLRPLVLESLLIAAASGACGLLVASACNRWIGAHVIFNNAPPGASLPLDARVLAFALLTSLATGFAFGCVPAWMTSRAPLAPTLRDGSRGTTGGRAQQRVRTLLVVAEFALALVLLAGAGLIAGGLQRFLQRDTGWRNGGIAFGYVATQTPRYREPDAAVDFYERMVERLAALPGVEGVAFGWDVPIAPDHEPVPFNVEGQAPATGGRTPLAFFTGVLPGYFSGLGIEQLAGRDFTRRDRMGTPRVAIVCESLARACWPDGDAVGRRIATNDPANPGWLEVVGVVRDVRFAGYLGEPSTRLQVYIPFAQLPWNWGAVALRTRAAPESLIEPMRRAIAEMDPDVPVWEPRTVDQEVSRRVANSRLTGQLLTGVALLGLFLAALGIYALIAHSVAQRTSEIGVRMALGADVTAVYRLILGSGLRMALFGIGIGIGGALVLVRALGTLMPEIPTASPALLGAVTGVLLAAAALATWLPARRAVRIDPIIALRGD